MAGNIEQLSGMRARGHSYAICVARWNLEITEPLMEGAVGALVEQGVLREHIAVHRCPGAFELLGAATRAAASGVDGVIAIGCLIKGDTDHYEYIAGPVSQGLASLSAEAAMRRKPVAISFGVLTVQTREQAQIRAAPGSGNKGKEAALACVDQVNLLRAIALP